MNPHFDGMLSGGGHITSEAIDALNAQFGTSYTSDTFSVFAILPYVNRDFSIKAELTGAQHDAVSEILMQSVGDHYIAGDGRVNENFGLTSIHHVFHEEHNYQVENLKTWIYAHDANNPGATDAHEQLHNWQVNNHLATNNMDANGNYLNVDGSISWDADKMFNGTKLIVEMEYQHAAVDQYARTVTPRIQEFVGYSTGVDATISLEYSQVAFRFGHSTIRETIDTVDPSGWMLGAVTRYALEQAFLSPKTFAEEGVASITLGLSRQQMNEVDEFITPALNQGLLGQPLDLPAINIARSRDLGIPTLNDFRAGIGLAEYTSWSDFGANMIHPESLVNFIAAYSFSDPSGVEDISVSQAKAQFILDLADGTATSSPTDLFGGTVTAADATAFLNNNYAGANTGLAGGQNGFDKIDSWIGGLAEAHVPGGLLGETFDAVFVAQIQSLMDGDRFYYLYRLFGTQIHEEVNNGQFKDIVERNTGLEHLNGSIFAYADKYYDFNREADGTEYTAAEQLANETRDGDYANHRYADLVATRGVYSDGGVSVDANGSSISVTASDGVRDSVILTNLIRDVRPDLQPDLVHPVEGTPTDGADSHEVIVGTQNADFIHARGGDDTVYGEEGDDYIHGDGGVDRLYGGDGNDLIDTGEGPDLADGGAGKDIIYGRGSGSEVGGFDQLVGGSGNDLIVGGEGIDKLSGGSGDDIIYGDGLTNPEMGNTDPFTHAGDGNDYIDGGASGDLLFGEEGDDYIVGGNDQDLIQGGQGDDIIRPGNPSQASGTTGGPDEVVGDDGQANSGFDLIDFSDYAANGPGVTVDFATQNNPLVNIDQTTTFPAWFQIEGAIGSRNADTFVGDSAGDATADNSNGANWLIGGSGSDRFTGNGGNDVMIGGSIRLDSLIGTYEGATFGNLALGSDAWLKDAMQTGGSGTGYDDNAENAYTGASNRATGSIGANGLLDAANAIGGGQFDKHLTDMLQSRMFRDVTLGDSGADAGSTDTAVFSGKFSEYSFEFVSFVAPNGQKIDAWKVTDHGGMIDDGTGVMAPRAQDGVDLLVGIESGVFADRTISLLSTPPALDLTGDHVETSTTTRYADNFGSAAYNNSNGTTPWSSTPWVETGDNGNTNSASAGQISIALGALRFGDNDTDAGLGTAAIQRTMNLAGFSGAATLSYTYQENSFDAGETVTVTFSDDGTFSAGHTQQIQVIDGSSNSGNISNVALTGNLTANSALRFVVSGTNNNNALDAVLIDNLKVDTTTSTVVPGAAGNNYATSYTEGGAGIAVSSYSSITDDGATITSARVVLKNAVAGDVLRYGNSASNSGSIGGNGSGVSYRIDNSVSGQIALVITGSATKAQYQGFLDQVRFLSTSDTPTDGNAQRSIDVTVSDGLSNSNVATTTINVTAVNDAPNGGDDYIVTNQTNLLVSDAFLKVNDTDVDGPAPLSIVSVNNATGLTASHPANSSAVTLADTGTAGGSFRYTVSDGGAANSTASANVTFTRQAGTAITGGTGRNSNLSEILIGGAGNEAITGNGGADTLVGGGGNDRFAYTSVNDSSTSSMDYITDFVAHNGNVINDLIDLSAIDARTNGANSNGNQAFAFSTTGAAAYSVWTELNAGNTYVYGDVNGVSNGTVTADFAIKIAGNVSLSASDFAL